MTCADEYRKRASELRVQARFAQDRERAAALNKLALNYTRLAKAVEHKTSSEDAGEQI